MIVKFGGSQKRESSLPPQRFYSSERVLLLTGRQYFAHLSFWQWQHSDQDECGAMVERYWRGKPKYWETNLSRCHSVHHKHHRHCPGIEHGPATNRLSHSGCCSSTKQAVFISCLTENTPLLHYQNAPGHCCIDKYSLFVLKHTYGVT
jgi:hypothetical protein